MRLRAFLCPQLQVGHDHSRWCTRAVTVIVKGHLPEAACNLQQCFSCGLTIKSFIVIARHLQTSG